MKYLSHRKKIILLLFIIIVSYFLIQIFQNGNKIPKEFTEARNNGSVVAQSIVNISNFSNKDLDKVNEYDKISDYTNALILTTDIIKRNSEISNEAIQLSSQLEIMTKNIPFIKKENARQEVIQSITSRVALISQLINYSNDLNTLLDVLRQKFTGQPIQRGEVQGLVNKINTDINAVNNFNSQATQAMTQFDKIMEN
jgi:hypothetical protein